MTVRKVIGLILISASIVLMIHSIVSLYLIQCLKSTVSIPSFFTNGMVNLFQLETSSLGKGVRMVTILILPSLGIELHKNKNDSLLKGSLLLQILGVLLVVFILCYILFYPFFE